MSNGAILRAPSTAFDPALIRSVAEAFREACHALPVQPPPDDVREVLANRITELAEHGERDVRRLRDHALAYLKSTEVARRRS